MVLASTQIPGVSYVEFQENGNPMTDSDGRELGPMERSSFVENEGKTTGETMCIEQVQHPDAELVQQLVSVWDSSIRATHHFLSEDEITAISHYVPQALTSVAHLIKETRIPCCI